MNLAEWREAGYRMYPTPYRTEDGQRLHFCSVAGSWRVVHEDDGLLLADAVGPCYASKADLLADLPRYAEEIGFPSVPGRPVAAGYIIAGPYLEPDQVRLVVDWDGEVHRTLVDARVSLAECQDAGYSEYRIYALTEVW